MRNLEYLAVALLSLSVQPLFASAQTQNTVVDLNAPSEEHKKLEPLLGEWEVLVRFPVGPGREMEGHASCTAKWVLDGRFLRQEYSSTFAGRPLTIVRYLGFDRHNGKFVEIHFESTHTDVLQSTGAISDDGKMITTSGTFTDRSVKVEVRSVTKIVDDNNFELQLVYTDPSGSRSGYPKTITLLHKRKAE